MRGKAAFDCMVVAELINAHPLAMGSAGWLQASVAVLATGTVTGASPVACAVSVMVPKSPSRGDSGPRHWYSSTPSGPVYRKQATPFDRLAGEVPGNPLWGATSADCPDQRFESTSGGGGGCLTIGGL